MKRFQLVLSALTLVASSATMASTTSINFDGTGAPCGFASTTQVTSLYTSSGVTFSNTRGISHGGAILNQCGGFGFSGHSGTDFLAYNLSTKLATDAINMAFSAAMGTVSIWAADYYTGATLLMQAFDSSNVLVSSFSLTGSRTWQQMSVSGTGITSVRLTGGTVGGFDDLSFSTEAGGSTVPEPGVLALVGLGLLGLAVSRRSA